MQGRPQCQLFLAMRPLVCKSYSYSSEIRRQFISTEVLHIAPLITYVMVMRCHIYKGTTSSLCTKIRAEHVEPGRSVLKWQQQQKVTQPGHTHTHTHTDRRTDRQIQTRMPVYTPQTHIQGGEKACGSGGERWLYEQHSSEIPRLKVAEAAEKPVSSEETLSNLTAFMKENMMERQCKFSGKRLEMVRIFCCLCTYAHANQTGWEKTANCPWEEVWLTHQRIGCS